MKAFYSDGTHRDSRCSSFEDRNAFASRCGQTIKSKLQEKGESNAEEISDRSGSMCSVAEHQTLNFPRVNTRRGGGRLSR